jgi:hypothetical protein
MRELVRLRRLVAMFKSYRLALTRAPVIKS